MDQLTATAVDIASRITSGDQHAETDLVTQYSRGLTLMLLKRTGDAQLANDCTQEALLIALTRLRAGKLRKPESLVAFLQQTAVNLTIGHYRKEKRYIYREDEINELQAAPYNKAERELDNETVRKLILQVLEQLPLQRDREMLRRYYLDEEQKSHICDALGLTATHFDRVLFRAKVRMRKLLKEHKQLATALFANSLDAGGIYE